MMRAIATSTWMRRCWITFVIVSLARLPLPILDLGGAGLEAHRGRSAALSPVDHVPSGWHWRWVTLSTGSFCPISETLGTDGPENDADADCCEVEADSEYLPSGLSRRIADPYATLAFDATPAGLDEPLGRAPSRAPRSFGATFAASTPRAALLQRWNC